MTATGELAGVIARHAAGLMALPGVHALGEGEHDGRPCLVVFVNKDSATPASLPDKLEGYAVVVRHVERFSAENGAPF
ncbi:MAG: hypothetical protein L6Q83_01430 [Gammaproteobacteria bacterium]|nr:hypothetical protein [Gammaproteobacteria bacterium]